MGNLEVRSKEGLLHPFLGTNICRPMVSLYLCFFLVVSFIIFQQNCPKWNPRIYSSSSRMFWVLNESSIWAVEPLA